MSIPFISTLDEIVALLGIGMASRGLVCRGAASHGKAALSRMAQRHTGSAARIAMTA